MKIRHSAKPLAFCIVLSCIILFIILAIFNMQVNSQPDVMTLDHRKIFVKKERAPVAFPHGTHMKTIESCSTCHHRYVNRKNALQPDELTEGNGNLRCSACHGQKQIDGRHGLMDAFHLQCSGCHRQMARQGKKSGPLMCGQCHPQKKVASKW